MDAPEKTAAEKTDAVEKDAVEKTGAAENIDDEHPDKSAYLKEAMRLVELRIEEQNASRAILERKAALLGTVCIAVIGYLGSTEFHAPQICGISEAVGKIIFLLLKISGIISLGGAIAYSISVFQLKHFVRRGSMPKAVLDPCYGYSYNKFVKCYLKGVKEKVQKSTKTIDDKAKKLNTAYCFLIIGLIFSFAFVLIHQSVHLMYQIIRFLS